jgi:hypothetical protein
MTVLVFLARLAQGKNGSLLDDGEGQGEGSEGDVIMRYESHIPT